MMRLLYLILIPLLLASCSTPKARDRPNSISTLMDQSILLKKLTETNTNNRSRYLVHLSHVCTLSINGQQLPVIDLRELVKGASAPRGINQILILNSKLEMLNQIEYYNSRPLFCRGNKLYIYGNLSIDGKATEGNVISFDINGIITDLLTLDTNEWF